MSKLSFQLEKPLAPVARPANDTTQDTTSAAWKYSAFIRIFFLAVLVYLGTTGFLPLVGRDEPRYVQIGRNMLDTGDWITPHLGGQTWFEKPVLLYWMVAASFSVFGVSEWAARLGPALCGLGSAALLWWMLSGTDRKNANWSAVVSLTSGGMLAFSHGATFDIVLTFTLTLALAAWWKAQIEVENSRKWLALFWAGVGLAFLSKGLVAFILPLGTIGLYAALKKERVKTGLWWGLPLALALSALWYGPVIAVNGQQFVNEFFVQHHFQRFTSDKYKHHQPFWFYLPVLFLFTLPWAPFFIMNLWRKVSNVKAKWTDIELFAFAWMMMPVAFFSLSGSKLPGYILPAIPGAAILIGAELSRWTSTARRRSAMLGLATFILVAAVVLTSSGPAIRRAEDKSARRLFEVAHERGYGHLPVVTFSTTVRAAEFYAASTLRYDAAGEPLTLENPSQLQQLARSGPLLVLVNDGELKLLQPSKLKLQEVARNKDSVLVLAKE